ncbi:MAG: Fe-S cluster assembly protein SufB [Nanoarchaeota archaeon]|nr:Fe-S cluster assembly protein SufB [Nanoarchaeota archaeon]
MQDLDFEPRRELYDQANEHKSKFVAKPGLSEDIVRLISTSKNEPEWMLKKRLQGLKLFKETPLPTWGPELKDLNFDKIVFYVDPDAKQSKKWEDVPKEIKDTFEKLGIPEAERKALAGVGAQWDSNIVYHNILDSLKKQGVVFENMDTAVHKYPELVKKYFMSSCIPVNDHKFIMLHAATWSGGTFIYIPKNVKVDLPLQAYFRMNQQAGGQFEHTLIIVDEGADLHYIEGCSSPRFTETSLHAGCVEIHVLPGAKMRYTSIENWSKNVYNLNTKRALVYKDARIEWINGNMGCLTEDSKVFTSNKGPTKIKDVKKGDTVYVWNKETNSLKESTVNANMYKGTKKIYKIEVGGREIEATPNHPFLTLIRKKNKPDHKKGFFHFEWKPLEGLKEGDVVGIVKQIPLKGKPYNLPKININQKIKSNNQYSKFEMSKKHLYNPEIITPKKTNEDFMWLMGILLGDGFINSKSNKINLAIHETDPLRDIIIEVVNNLFNYKITTKKERYMEIYSKVLCNLFTEIGFSGDALSKRIPQWVFTLPEKQILSFLGGYLDSDGHVCENALAYTSISKPILKNIRLLSISCGIGTSKIFKHGEEREVIILGNKCHANKSWRILTNGKKVNKILMRSPIKKKKAREIKSRRDYGCSEGLNFRSKTNEEIGFCKIKKITEMGKKPTYDLEIEKYHNFIAEGFIVHNSSKTMLYPASILLGENAEAESLGIVFAGPGQDQDTGAKVVHIAPNTKSLIRSKSISKGGGISTYRGLVKVGKNAKNTKSNVECDALLIDEESTSNTYPYMKIDNKDVSIGHEARVGKIGEEEIFYLMSRGLSEQQAIKMVVSGFIEPIVKALPFEYAIELNKLIELEVEGL